MKKDTYCYFAQLLCPLARLALPCLPTACLSQTVLTRKPLSLGKDRQTTRTIRPV